MMLLLKKEDEALRRLIAHAKRDSGQSRRVANFLLSWWNSSECGGFALTEMWGCDDDIVVDMVTVFGLVGRTNSHPDRLGFQEDFVKIVSLWRPE